MFKNKKQIIIKNKKERLEMYLERERYMLSPDGVRMYTIGSRNLMRYDTVLKDIQDMIRKLEDELSELEIEIKPRKAIAVVPRDW